MKKSTVALLLFAASFSVNANSGKWCEAGAKKYDLHLFGHTYRTTELERLAKKGVTDLKAQFVRGDRVRVFTHTNNGFTPVFDQCVPGCPKRGMLETFFGGDCSEQVAKKEYINFEQKFAVLVLSNFGKQENRASYNIFSNVQQLNDVYRAGNEGNEVYAVISLIPEGVNPRDRRALNDLYRRANETLQFPKNFPAVKIIGASTDSELIEFWKDVLRSKGSFNFVAF
jgi:hypothetical protein